MMRTFILACRCARSQTETVQFRVDQQALQGGEMFVQQGQPRLAPAIAAYRRFQLIFRDTFEQFAGLHQIAIGFL